MSESSSIELIPQPPVWASVRSIKNISTLTDAEKELLREKLVECSLPLDKSWSRQNPEDIQQFLKRITMECPFLTAYENSWPAEALMRDRLSRRERCTVPVKGTKATTTGTTCSRRTSDRHALHETANNTTVQNSSSRRVCDSISELRPRMQLTSSVISDFLSSLHPNLEALTTRFVQVGVRTEDDLEGLAIMPNQHRSRFLRSDLELTAFQATVVDVGLAERYPTS